MSTFILIFIIGVIAYKLGKECKIYYKCKHKNKEDRIMAAIDELNQSVSTLQSSVNSVLVKIDELKNQPNNDAAISAAASSINESIAKLNGAIQFCIGTYDTPEQAALAYNNKAIELCGEYARINIIK